MHIPDFPYGDIFVDQVLNLTFEFPEMGDHCVCPSCGTAMGRLPGTQQVRAQRLEKHSKRPSGEKGPVDKQEPARNTPGWSTAFGYSKKIGVGVARVIGNHMNPTKITQMAEYLKIDPNQLNLQQFEQVLDSIN